MSLPVQGARMKVFPAVVLGVCALVSGCGVYKITRQDAKEAGTETTLGGVPFLTRVPATYQVTKLVQTRWKVQYVMKVGGEEYRAPAAPFDMLLSEDGTAALLKINRDLDSKGAQLTPKSFHEAVEKLVNENAQAWHTCGVSKAYDRVCADGADANSTLISNALVIKTEISSQQHYINVRRPWVGKASASVELASDGTLTKSTGEIESKTVETIAGIIPFADYAKKVLKLGDYAVGLGNASNAYSLFSEGTAPVASRKISISYEMTPEPWLYVLQKKGKTLEGSLSYSPTGQVELVEASKVAAAPAKKDEEAPKGWSISGTVTPPAAKGK